MNGLLFREFLRFIEQLTSYETVDRIIQNSHICSDGAYTTIGTYPPQELFCLVKAFSDDSMQKENSIIQAFGQYMFAVYLMKYPSFFANKSSTYDFLTHIEKHVQKCIKAFYHGMILPSMQCNIILNHSKLITYHASPHFADFTAGIIDAAIHHFHETLQCTRDNIEGEHGLTVTFHLHERFL